MSFETLTLADVKLEKPAPVPAGQYVFQLQPGSAVRENPFTHVTELNVRFDVAEGEYAGRPVFQAYPDPETLDKNGKPMSWSAQALKKLEIALGVDSLPGENTQDYLNRVALNGDARIIADILPGKTFIDNKTGKERLGDPKFGVFT